MEKHKHCVNCGLSIPPEESFCSQKCKEEFVQKRKKMMRSQQIFFVAMLVILAVYAYTAFF
ncbi:DUF2116 family Zn-ribbon domain-containing protein [Methanococcus maripaludis]|jgi:predicted nucleic acid-binding Zn ribbon protein|uniref:DUF2116 family Zn-ribbon domain-containing protein n=5 Tax=Methanococcus maripaludis TaxID=39152 RepID=A0A7J9S6M2_METMI|nr:DUF2116 family Zn-ribbon domain-containing protein [Methanococcus maripaludis]ABO35552.1 conserved hypothetical protein [Methanococcus maripaludis C5]AEK19281.1 hypothetical protein GYY_01990 [Methanococcus maripaludis X1]MBA2851460.1 putative nucleic acid-binding Zn ribbon protein [Methanococcus maripaludis]MBA2853085.1 putative nucleic acid-binding Zn ribbon protein [Methanococcus maripaludis]MBB6401686.1 putative nucleic acid-binding Zn ribbon protein [Methanococcus maripaludis]